MKKLDIEKLSTILSSENFKFTKLSNETRVKLVRVQILADPVAEELKKARETANKKFMPKGGRLEELFGKFQSNELKEGTEEAAEFRKLFDEYNKNMEDTIRPMLDADKKIDLPKINVEEFGKVMDANEDYLTGNKPMFLFLHIVDDKPLEKKAEEKA